MDPTLIWTAGLIAALFLGLHGAYFGALADACLKIGKNLAPSEGSTGYQDAITPPSSTNARLLNWLVTLILTGGFWVFSGVTGIAVFLTVRLVTTIIVGAMLKADPPKKHFCLKIYSSMSNREADFSKTGDNIRAEAMRHLRLQFERSSYANELGY